MGVGGKAILGVVGGSGAGVGGFYGVSKAMNSGVEEVDSPETTPTQSDSTESTAQINPPSTDVTLTQPETTPVNQETASSVSGTPSTESQDRSNVGNTPQSAQAK